MFFFPYKVDRVFMFPWMTVILILVNVIVYFATFMWLDQAVAIFGFALNARAVYTWFTSMFMHGDLIGHLLGNMYFLWLFGSVVEDAIGRWRFLGLYIVGGLVSTVFHEIVVIAFMPELIHVPLIGASGAIAAVMGIFAVRMYRNNVRVAYFMLLGFHLKYGTFKISSVWGVTLWFLREVGSMFLQIAGAQSSVANGAHVGGLAFGAAAAFIFGLAREANTEMLAEEAGSYAQFGASQIAADRFAELEKRDPDNPQWVLEKLRMEVAAGSTDTATVSADFRRAIELLVRAGDREKTQAVYRDFGTGSLAIAADARALVGIGGSLEAARLYEEAAHAYHRTVTETPDSRDAEKALFRLAHVYLAQGKTDSARQTWTVFEMRYPTSEWMPYADAGLTSAPE